MEPAFDVIVCGSLHLDIVVKTEALPRIDETAVGREWAQVCGGKGGNQAVQAARAGARTAMIGCIGDDAFGQTLRANLITENVDVHGVAVEVNTGSGMSVAILQDNGEYGAVIVSASNLLIDPTDSQDQWQQLGGGKVLILQNEIPHKVNVAMAKIARGSGARVVYNAAPARELDHDLRDVIDVLIVNRVEAEAMSGSPVRNRAQAREVLLKLARSWRSVIVTLGGEGLVVTSTDGEVFDVDPLPVTVTSTHGAGDCFVGALCARLAAGEPLFAACQMANQAAAAFVSRPI